MPRSKRHKVVSLTKTKAKSMEDKTETIEMLRSAVDEYKNIFAFTYENMRSAAFKEVRMHFKESRLFWARIRWPKWLWGGRRWTSIERICTKSGLIFQETVVFFYK